MILRCFIGMILLLAGGGVYRTISQQIDQKASEIALAKSQCDSTDTPYWNQYRQWSALPLEEQFKNMWGEDKYGKLETAQERSLHQQILLISDIKALASGQKDPGPFAEVIYGEDWQSRLEGYKEQRANHEKWIHYSFGLIGLGGLVIAESLMWSGLKHIRRSGKKDQGHASVSGQKDKSPKNSEAAPQANPVKPRDKTLQLESGLGDYWTNKTDQTVKGVSHPENWVRPKIHVRPDKENPSRPAPTSRPSQVTAGSTPRSGNTAALREVRQVVAHHEDGNLDKLTKEVTALREFAATQQNHVQKLQDGYDWTILKNFCLRIIRCIDNLETRIHKLENLGEDVESLQDVCDEMIFALESSGVERYKPDIKSAYHGQERLMEILRDRVDCDNPELEDKVAKVVRPGYQYVVDDDNIKIVRTAQVKLYKRCLAEVLL